ncbi:MAG: twin-arginine translocase subunit TatC [Alphaproteobacteria bacterium]|nr:twin-arginine translocase subunit TatC [Alphaproteobacteria bacterium]
MSENLENQTSDNIKQPLIAHVLELRKRLIWVFSTMILSTIICYFYVNEIYGFLVMPLANAMGPGDTQRLIYTDLTEAFFTYLKVAFFSGIFLTFPVLLIQVWIFVAPGLYEKEKRAFLPFLAATPILFFLGAACVYYLVLPMAWPFFLSFQVTREEAVLPIQLEARVSEYLDLIMTLIFAFGLCFQMPVFLTLLGYVGLITPEWLAERRKYMIIVIFIVAAVLTPPDILSQILLAIPLMGLYELSILMIRMVAPKSNANPENSSGNDTNPA